MFAIQALNFPTLAKRSIIRTHVIPVKTGIQEFNNFYKSWIPAFAGMTSFCEGINLEL